MPELEWVGRNWGDVVQTVGIIGSLALASWSFLYQVKSQRALGFLQITERHADLWKELLIHPELSRIQKESVDLTAKPVTDKERVFLRLLFLHMQSIHRAVELGLVTDHTRKVRDFREFFSLPIPKVVWFELQRFLEPAFVAQVERELYDERK